MDISLNVLSMLNYIAEKSRCLSVLSYVIKGVCRAWCYFAQTISLETSINQGGSQWNAVRIFVTHHYVAQNTAISTQIGGTQACIKSSVNTSTHCGVNNCRYLLQHREQWRESSPQILKALSVSGTANRKSNLLCHTETCLTTLNNCTAALERAVFLLSNEGLQGKEHGTMCFISVCVCLRMCMYVQVWYAMYAPKDYIHMWTFKTAEWKDKQL